MVGLYRQSTKRSSMGVSAVRVDCGPEGGFSVLHLLDPTEKGVDLEEVGQEDEEWEAAEETNLTGDSDVVQRDGSKAPELSSDEEQKYQAAMQTAGAALKTQLTAWLVAAREMLQVS
jgi:hypothetical protein